MSTRRWRAPVAAAVALLGCTNSHGVPEPEPDRDPPDARATIADASDAPSCRLGAVASLVSVGGVGPSWNRPVVAADARVAGRFDVALDAGVGEVAGESIRLQVQAGAAPAVEVRRGRFEGEAGPMAGLARRGSTLSRCTFAGATGARLLVFRDDGASLALEETIDVGVELGAGAECRGVAAIDGDGWLVHLADRDGSVLVAMDSVGIVTTVERIESQPVHAIAFQDGFAWIGPADAAGRVVLGFSPATSDTFLLEADGFAGASPDLVATDASADELLIVGADSASLVWMSVLGGASTSGPRSLTADGRPRPALDLAPSEHGAWLATVVDDADAPTLELRRFADDRFDPARTIGLEPGSETQIAVAAEDGLGVVLISMLRGDPTAGSRHDLEVVPFDCLSFR